MEQDTITHMEAQAAAKASHGMGAYMGSAEERVHTCQMDMASPRVQTQGMVAEVDSMDLQMGMTVAQGARAS